MKVFGLQGSVYRFARVASRLTADTSAIAAVRRDALQRFDRARRDGLTAVQPARAVGVPRSTLYRWRARIEPRSRRPDRFAAALRACPLSQALGSSPHPQARAAPLKAPSGPVRQSVKR